MVARALVSRLSFFFFFFFFFFFLEFTLTQLDLCRLSFDSRRTGPIRPESSCSTESGYIDWRPKQPKSALNHAETAKIGFQWGPNILNLSFLNFILNICCFFYDLFFVVFFFFFFFFCCFLPSFFVWIKAIVMCFFKKILIVKIYRKYK